MVWNRRCSRAALRLLLQPTGRGSYDSGFYLGVLKKHWLGGRNGEVLYAAAPDVCARMGAATDMHTFMVAAAERPTATEPRTGTPAPPP